MLGEPSAQGWLQEGPRKPMDVCPNRHRGMCLPRQEMRLVATEFHSHYGPGFAFEPLLTEKHLAFSTLASEGPAGV